MELLLVSYFVNISNPFFVKDYEDRLKQTNASKVTLARRSLFLVRWMGANDFLV